MEKCMCDVDWLKTTGVIISDVMKKLATTEL